MDILYNLPDDLQIKIRYFISLPKELISEINSFNKNILSNDDKRDWEEMVRETHHNYEYDDEYDDEYYEY
jgi:hypothetical protein